MSSSSFGTDSYTPLDSFDSAANSIAAAAIVSIMVGVISVVAIVIAIIYCLRKAGKSIPTHAQAQLTVGRSDHQAPMRSSQGIYGGAMVPWQQQHQPGFQYLVINDSQVEAATMEKFLSNMAREKPIRFSPQQLSGFTQNFSKVLGSGGFGVVYKGEFPNGEAIAVKVLKNNSAGNKRVEEQFMAEVGTIGRTYHINLVRLYGFCFDSTMSALVYEFMENGSLDQFLFGGNSSDRNHSIEWDKLHGIAVRTAKAIAYLHEECWQRIIHYDIKPGNVLLDSNLNPKVADFGLAKLSNRDSSHILMSGCRGTPGYAAPELWTPYPVTHKCDVYSFGMLLFEIVARRRNHDAGLSGMSQEWLPRWTYEKCQRNEMLDMFSACGIEEKDREKAERTTMVALWCVQYLPAARPLMSSVVRMLEGGGGGDLGTPPNPFSHMEDNFGSNMGRSAADSNMSSSSVGMTSSSSQHYSSEKSFEIRPASNT